MKIKILIISFLVSFFNSTSEKEFSYALPKYYKLKSTLSLKIANQKTLHLAVAKNKNSSEYNLIPFFMNKEGKVNKLSTLSFKDEPELVSFHIVGNQLTLINYQNDQLIIDDLAVDGTSSKRKIIEDTDKPKNIITEAHETLFLKKNEKEKNIQVTRVSNSENINELNFKIPSNLENSFDRIFDSKLQIINTEEFVKNGSISNFQAYYKDDKINLIFNEDEKDQNISLIAIDLQGENHFKLMNFKTPEMEKLKNSNSYFKNNKLFVINSGKDDIQLNVFNAEKENLLKNLSLKKNLSHLAKNKEDLEDFIDNARKSKNKPTVTINETKNGKLAVRMDYVNKNSYHYYDFWWMQWQFHWQMQMQHTQMMNQVPRSFGPNITSLEIDDLYYNEKDHSYTLILDENLEIDKQKNKFETIYPIIEEEKYKKRIEEMEKNLKIENTSLSFLNTTYRLFYSNKNENKLYIKTFNID
ncbi:hypothetical protein [Mesonia aestuariivivens]|uniref:Uncharacterized protein n=1 Tax=Mesonia aestuariivivens TaxID=2796128 RepID=A0ABS6VY38_9FLAO|nr:hypothetical protein [Mesonia aestuariivivens]MBW2960511.1 hypothetical protein [Mesonia aestuariivivens]